MGSDLSVCGKSEDFVEDPVFVELLEEGIVFPWELVVAVVNAQALPVTAYLLCVWPF